MSQDLSIDDYAGQQAALNQMDGGAPATPTDQPDSFLIFKDKYSSEGLGGLGGSLEDLAAKIGELEDRVKELKEERKYLEEYAIPAKLEAEGMKNFKLTSGKLVHLRGELQVTMAAGDRPMAMLWFKDHGHGSMVQEHIPPQTLKAWVKNDCLGNMTEPPPFIKVRQFQKAVLKS
jgi:hypothetical protein